MIYFVENEAVSYRLLEQALSDFPIPTKGFTSAEALLETVGTEAQLVLLDLGLDGMDGLTCLSRLREKFPKLPVIIISANQEQKSVTEALARGATWYLKKPCGVQEIRRAAENVLLSTLIKVPALQEVPEGSYMSSSTLDKIAKSDRTVLIQGENGTGKTALANVLHNLGPRKDRPFISISCASIPSELFEAELFGFEKGTFTGANATKVGLVELADGGTLFLDEIGELPPQLQPKLLTFLQSHLANRLGSRAFRKFDVRVIVATNQDLAQMISQRRFREDLYYRISTLTVTVPPLRQRRSEISEISQNILARIRAREGGEEKHLSKCALERLKRYGFPGNIRELENIIERANLASTDSIINAEHLELGNLATQVEKSICNSVSLAQLEVEAINESLRRNQGNRALTAKDLGITERTLYNKLKKSPPQLGSDPTIKE